MKYSSVALLIQNSSGTITLLRMKDEGWGKTEVFS